MKDSDYNFKEIPLIHYRQTLSVIFRFAEQYKSDLKPFEKMSIREFYDYVHNLPFKADPQGKERVQRPLFTLSPEWDGSRDCDDKSTLLGAFMRLKKIDFALTVAGRDTTPHHVYPESITDILPHGSKTKIRLLFPLDATYPGRGGFGKKLYNEHFRETYIFHDSKLIQI